MALPNRFTIEPIWTGKTAIIIGGGPSLTLKQIRDIAVARKRAGSDFRVIAVNDAIIPAYWADWHHACDGIWWNVNIQTVYDFPGIKTTLDETIPEPWVSGYLLNTGGDGFDPDPSCCRTGANGVYQAMCIAIHTGVRKIILVGVDMKAGPKGEKHWFGNHKGIAGSEISIDYQKQMASYFPGLVPTLTLRGVDVVNASPGSALTAFRPGDLETELQ